MPDPDPPAHDAHRRLTLAVVPVGGAAGPGLARAIAELHATRLHPVPAAGDGAAAGTVAALQEALVAVTEELVLFVRHDADPPAGWLDRALEEFDRRDGLSCLALTRTPPVSVLGLPLGPVPAGHPPDDVLYAPLGAMLARAEHLRLVGGFDVGMDGGGADIDLGWRLWLLGGWVRCCPTALGPGGPSDPEPTVPPLDATSVACALARVFLYYEEAQRASVLPAALLALPAVGDGDEVRRGIEQFSARLPELRRAREAVQARRRRRDNELAYLFSRPLDLPPGLRAAVAPVAEGLGLEATFGARRRILIVTADVLTARMAGPAIRAWQIADALAADHDVRLATLSPTCELHSDRFEVEAADQVRLVELEDWCDVVILQGYVLHGAEVLRTTEKIMVVDIYDPLHFETLELSKRDEAGSRTRHVGVAVDTLNEQLRRGDFFICASSKQRDLWIGQLSAVGRINPVAYDDDPTLRRLIDVVPFGLPDEPARHQRPAIKGVVPGIGIDDEVILWGGGIYNWFDPLTLIRAVDKLRRRRPQVRLFFLGVRHPNPGVNPMLKTAAAAQQLADKLGLTNTHVFFNDNWVDYEDRQNYLIEADLGVSTHLDHAETAYSFRTRILDYLWAGLPIVATDGDGFAELIDREGLGLVVPAEDVDALEAALWRVLDDRVLNARCRANVERLRPGFAWSEILRPLLSFCNAPQRARDLVGIEAAPVAAAPTPGQRLAGDLRIVRALYHEGGARRVLAGAATRAARQARRSVR